MKKYGMTTFGSILALFCVLLGLATAMTPAPSNADRAIVLLSSFFFFVGIGLVITGLIKAKKGQRQSDS